MLVQVSVLIDGQEQAGLNQELSGSAEEMEEQVREVLQRTGRVMLRPAFQQIADRTAAHCCCGICMKNCGRRTLGVMTTCGEVVVERRRYRCRDCGRELYPADARLCCGKHRVSKPLAKRICQLAAVEHFTRLPELVAAQHGVSLCHETMLELAHDVGGAAERIRLAEAQSSIARQEPPQVTVVDPPQRIYVSVDGIMYCTNEREADPDQPDQKHLLWQQMKVGCVYWQDARERWHKQMVWGRESPEEFGASLWRLAMQCGFGQAKEKLFVADGGGWCWDIRDWHFTEATGILDWYHVSEHVWTAAKLVHPESPRDWADEALTHLREDGGAGMADWLNHQIAPRRGQARKALDALHSYVAGKVHCMDYPSARQHGWQIGSGMIESTCKQLVAQRLKGPGMHWSEQGGVLNTAGLRHLEVAVARRRTACPTIFASEMRVFGTTPTTCSPRSFEKASGNCSESQRESQRHLCVRSAFSGAVIVGWWPTTC